MSYFVSYVIAEADSKVSPSLEVVYSSGRLQLHSERANYSFGELHKAFDDVFQELELYAHPPQRMLVLGLGAGSIPHLLQKAPTQITGVELDPAVIDLGRTFFGLDEYPHLEIIEEDAAVFAVEDSLQYDVICVDVFVDEHVPEQMEHIAVLEGLRKRLAEGGTLIWNRVVATPETKERTERFLELFSIVFPNYRIHRVLTNYMLIAHL